jgi:membrane protease YdiL (CAAX protease family)
MAARTSIHDLPMQAERLASEGAVAPGVLAQRKAVAWVLVTYGAVGLLAASIAAALGHNPVEASAWVGIAGAPGVMVSAGLGVVVAAATIAATRVMVRRAAWARALHADLRPGVRAAPDATLLALALASGIGEELLFRGLLVPIVGVAASALAFGALHQVRGRARWAWIGWAAVMGFVFGAIFAATGSLAGPVVAHCAINFANLRFLRDNDLAPRKARRLGGLLGQST